MVSDQASATGMWTMTRLPGTDMRETFRSCAFWHLLCYTDSWAGSWRLGLRGCVCHAPCLSFLPPLSLRIEVGHYHGSLPLGAFTSSALLQAATLVQSAVSRSAGTMQQGSDGSNERWLQQSCHCMSRQRTLGICGVALQHPAAASTRAHSMVSLIAPHAQGSQLPLASAWFPHDSVAPPLQCLASAQRSVMSWPS